MYLKTAKQSNTTSWEEEAVDETTNPPTVNSPKVTFSNEVTVIPTSSDQQEPKRAGKEVANLDSSHIVNNNGPSARNTRSIFAAAAAALAAMASVTQANTGITSPCPTDWNLMKLLMQSWTETGY